MYIVMLLDGQEVGRSQLLCTSRVSKEMEELRKKYRKEIEKADAEPRFYIEGIPSVINDFKSPLSNAKE